MNIRESIITILREETKFERLVKQQIKDHGLAKTAKMMGMSKIDLINLIKVPIDGETANELIYGYIKSGKLTNEYGKFKLNAGFNGVITWFAKLETGYFPPNITERVYVMATPFWDGSGNTPIDLDEVILYENGNKILEVHGDDHLELDHQSEFKDIDELLTWYNEFYLPNVYDIIMNNLLPKFYRENSALSKFFKGKD